MRLSDVMSLDPVRDNERMRQECVDSGKSGGGTGFVNPWETGSAARRLPAVHVCLVRGAPVPASGSELTRLALGDDRSGDACSRPCVAGHPSATLENNSSFRVLAET